MALLTRRNVLIGAIVVGIPILALGWWLGSPLFITNEVDEEFPMSAGAIVPVDMTPEEVEAEMETAADSPVDQTDEPMPGADPVKLVGGVFVGADSFHEGSGRATIYDLGDGERVLRLEAFTVTNGPALHVLLVPNARPEGRDDVTGYLDLGELKGNVGNQNYEIPADVDVTEFGSVVIYCEPFHVIFATAGLS
ncbi:MAG: DM13 domain-containing protein [Acidobacteria bacterium]|nr:DM13 domain-containing protein [Acidobacteriota bacterium]